MLSNTKKALDSSTYEIWYLYRSVILFRKETPKTGMCVICKCFKQFSVSLKASFQSLCSKLLSNSIKIEDLKYQRSGPSLFLRFGEWHSVTMCVTDQMEDSDSFSLYIIESDLSSALVQSCYWRRRWELWDTLGRKLMEYGTMAR